MLRNWFFAAFLATGLAVSLFGQTTASEILGFVTDQSGAAIAGAKVTVTRASTGEVRATTTGSGGEYSFPAADIGEYNVTVEAPGFKTGTVTGVKVATQEKARVDFKLEVGALTEKVEVTAEAVALKTDDATVGQVIENKRITELPLNGRNMQMLAAMVAGVQIGTRTGGQADPTQGGFPIPGAGISVIANGQREISANILLDGVDAKEPRTHITIFTPSIDAVEEFKVQTSSYSAEFGQGSGAQVQITMKAGSNDLHGTLFEFLRNDKLDATNYFLNFQAPPTATLLPKDRLRQNQFGAVLSGPVLIPKLYNGKNRTFWAFDYEGRRTTQESVQTAWYPDQLFRTGNFSELLHPNINPATGKNYRDPIQLFDPLNGLPIANNIIPASRLSQGAMNTLQYLPQPQFQQADLLDFTNRSAVPQTISQNQFYARGDHEFRSSDKIFGRIALDRSEWYQNYINPSFPYFLTSRATNLASQWIHTFSPTTINELHFGFNIANDDTFNPRSNTNFNIDSLGIGQFRVATDNNRPFTPREAGIPPLSFGDTGLSLGDRDGGNGYDRLANYQWSDGITFVRNRHSLKAGFEYRYIRITRAAANIPRGSENFSSLESGFDFASFMMGYPDSVSTGEGFPLTLPRANRFAAYFLDEWKPSSRLTVNAGLRWDRYDTPVDAGGYWRTLSLVQTTSVPGVGALPTVIPPGRPSAAGAIPLWPAGPGSFEPRLGIAFRPTDKWVIRAGGGYFSSVEHMNNYTILNLMPPLSGSLLYNAVTNPYSTIPVTANGQTASEVTRVFAPNVPILTLDNPFAGSGKSPARTNLLMVAPNTKQPTVWEWSFDLQRELPLQTVLTVAYVGNKSTHISNSIGNFNSPDPSPSTNIDVRRPYQQYYDSGVVRGLGTIRFLDSYANGDYHSLQVTAEKRYAQGFTFGLAYTYGKALGVGEAGGNEGILVQDPRNLNAARGPYNFDIRHNFVAHYVWEMPFLNRFHGPAGFFLAGWQLNGIITLHTGFPFTLTQGGDLNTGGTVFPDRVADGRLASPSRALWFDPSAFTRVTCNIPGRPDLCRYGDAGKGILTSPGQRNLDASLFKNFVMHERFRMAFRAEMFNTFNTPYFNQPNGIGFVGVNTLVPNAPRMGEVRSLRSPMRIIQFGLKFYF
ncbi:MAG TPA: TonB-dependent receptor [Bryobacteraceae bacterium]|nr:TonB-dependent receptor [Bryobacteraceae bacterium]